MKRHRTTRQIFYCLFVAASSMAGQALPGASDSELLTVLRQFSAIQLGPPPFSGETPSRALTLDTKTDERLADQFAQASDDSRALTTNAALLPVEIECRSVEAASLAGRQVAALGRTVTSVFDRYIFAELSAQDVSLVAAMAGVTRVAPQDRLISQWARSQNSEQTGAEGGQRMHVSLIRAQGITGHGVKIGIIDQGFAGMDELAATHETLRSRPIRVFGSSRDLKVSRHGTACAEIISAIAPGAELYLAGFDGREDHLLEAARWLIDQGVQILNFSGANPLGSTDGSDRMSQFIDRHPEVLWVIGAGNAANTHWGGAVTDANGDGYLDIGEDGSPFLAMIPMEPQVDIFVRWSAASSAERTTDSRSAPKSASEALPRPDLDVYLVEADAKSRRVRWVAKSAHRQRKASDSLTEEIHLAGPEWEGRHLALIVRKEGTGTAASVHVVVASAARILPRKASGSVLSPSSAASAVSVGAFDVLEDRLAVYSGQGPTDDGRVKPELVAPTRVSSRVMVGAGGRFTGTSAAAPHAAALAALLIERYRPTSVEQTRSLLMRASIPAGAVRPNNQYGYGQMDAAGLSRESGRLARKEVVADPVDLPERFGGTVSAALLDRLRSAPAAENSALRADVTADQTSYHFGESIRITVSASSSANCSLLYRDSAGHYSVLAAELAVPGDRAIPFPVDGHDLQAGAPEGLDEMLLICGGTDPIDISAVDPQNLPASLAVARREIRIVR